MTDLQNAVARAIRTAHSLVRGQWFEAEDGQAGHSHVCLADFADGCDGVIFEWIEEPPLAYWPPQPGATIQVKVLALDGHDDSLPSAYTVEVVVSADRQILPAYRPGPIPGAVAKEEATLEVIGRWTRWAEGMHNSPPR